MITYSDRVWLNKPESRSTGSVVAFEGMVDYGEDKGPDHTAFLEVSDCHSKVRLHMANYDTRDDFIYKMKLLQQTINNFVEHLEK